MGGGRVHHRGQQLRLEHIRCPGRSAPPHCTASPRVVGVITHHDAMDDYVSLGRAGRELGVSGGDIRRAGHRRVSTEQLDHWQSLPPKWLIAARRRKHRSAQRVEAMCCICQTTRLVRPDLIQGSTHLVCGPCTKAGSRPPVVHRDGMVLVAHGQVAGFFVAYTHRIAAVAKRESIARAIELARTATVHGLTAGASPVRERRSAVRFVADSNDRIWITKPILRSRGWTDAAIRDFLPAPEGHKRNPHYSTAPPMAVWTPETVASAESSQMWKDWLAKSLRQRGLTLPPAATGLGDERFAAKVVRAAAAIAACQERTTQ
jgi:hypothetical protein